MDIPYYYNSGYADDGVDIYTCLMCGDGISVRGCYKPNFCPYCGVKYEGEKENIGNNNKRYPDVCYVERFYWSIEEKLVEIGGDPFYEEPWTEKGYYKYDRNQTSVNILAEKRKYEIR